VIAKPKYGVVYRSLGIAYAMLGDTEKSVTNYEKYLKLVPEAKDKEKVEAIIAAARGQAP
jgi:hypothetical protein